MYRYVKRMLDILGASAALILLVPVGAVTAFLIWVSARANPFFTQERPGKNGKIFRLLKFRTMNDRRDAAGNLLPDADRLTPIGTVIRRLSLDEIPQLVNVLAGDMSLIGPRPLLVEYLPLYSPEQARRHEVKPGITGWAQINGRNAIDWEQKFRYDVWYVDHIGFALDLKILWLTPGKVIRRKNIEYAPKIPMKKFRGFSKTDKPCIFMEPADTPK